MIGVRFVRTWRMYQPGEIAGFDASVADQLVGGGFAVIDGAQGLAAASPTEAVAPTDATEPTSPTEAVAPTEAVDPTEAVEPAKKKGNR